MIAVSEIWKYKKFYFSDVIVLVNTYILASFC